MSSPKISVIVPIYNAGCYLRKTLDSIVNQTLKEIEIILVLDCPTDGSDILAKEYAEYDKRIIIVQNEKNLHIGMSRNKGLKIASGKYVTFVDHDDYLDTSMYEKMYQMMCDNNFDMVCSSHLSLLNGQIEDTFTIPDSSPGESAIALFENCVGRFVSDDMPPKKVCRHNIWNKLFRLDIIKENGLYFVDTCKYTFEDWIFMIEYSHKCQSIGYINEPLYFHLLGIGNTGSSCDYLSSNKLIASFNYVHSYLLENNVSESVLLRLYGFVKRHVWIKIGLASQRSTNYFKRIWLILAVLLQFRREKIVVLSFKTYQDKSGVRSGIRFKIVTSIVSFIISR